PSSLVPAHDLPETRWPGFEPFAQVLGKSGPGGSATNPRASEDSGGNSSADASGLVGRMRHPSGSQSAAWLFPRTSIFRPHGPKNLAPRASALVRAPVS